jgi:hypothetical protein
METENYKGTSKYTFERPEGRDHFAEYIETLDRITQLAEADKEVKAYLLTHLIELRKKLDDPTKTSNPARLQCYSSFLPPRLVTACKEGTLIPFFGSGISIAAGIPTWGTLLETLGIASDYISDPHVENDPLTQAELIALDLGTDALQQKLREQMKVAATPALAHYQLAALRLPVYITTNYDGLFEQAWSHIWDNTGYQELIVVTNDTNVIAHELNTQKRFPIDGKSVLIKMHGDSVRPEGLLILTRSDYRRHYRSNTMFFELVKGVMQSGHVLFLGFGHRDPEVSRLVEDVVYDYETKIKDQEKEGAEEHERQRPPTLYSVQFDMRQRTPEVFAARGIVALRPPAVISTLNPNQLRSASLAIELGELMAATDDEAHDAMNLKALLAHCETSLSNDIAKAMDLLGARQERIVSILNDKAQLKAELEQLIAELSPLELAGQGVYVTRMNGDIAAMAVPEGLREDARNELKNYANRPYFRQARAFRRAFVSDVIPSRYNGHSTVFLCMPLGNELRFDGLLFAAVQPGAWSLPLKLRDECLPKVEFVLVDSNGIAIVPPVQEMKPMAPVQFLAGESPNSNQGFPFERIKEISRRDNHILHIVQNVVPVGWDDDVHDVSSDLRLYSMVADVSGTRWKLALSQSVPSTLSKSA